MIYHLLQAMLSTRVCSRVLFPAWCDSSLCVRRHATFSLTITETFPTESASTLRIETFGCVFQTVGECDRRPWSLYGIMNDTVMSPGSQVGARLEGERKKKKKKKKAPGTASFITRVKGQVFIIVKKGPVENWLRVSQVIYLWTTSRTHTYKLHGDPPDEGCDRRVFVLRYHESPKASYLFLPGSVICCIRESEKYLGWSQFPRPLSVYLPIVSFPPFFVFREKKKKNEPRAQFIASWEGVWIWLRGSSRS